MRYKSKWIQIAFSGLMICTISSTGCKSGWKMPGADMFSWGKKPSESTLAGSGPSTTYPTSPALAATPNQVPNSAGTASRPTGANPYASANPSGLGAATAANGYQTQPYGTAGLASATPSAGPYGASNPYGSSSAMAPNSAAGVGYGGATGSYAPARPTGLAGTSGMPTGMPGGMPAGMGGYSVPNTNVAGAMPPSGSSGMGMPTFGSGGPSASGFQPPSAGLASAPAGMNQTPPYTPAGMAGGFNGAAAPGASNGFSASNPYASAPAGAANNPFVASNPNAASNPYAMPNAAAQSVPSTANPYAVNGAQPASYSPGSTQRSTMFSNNLAQPQPGTANAAGGFPATATPGYMAPPSNLTR